MADKQPDTKNKSGAPSSSPSKKIGQANLDWGDVDFKAGNNGDDKKNKNKNKGGSQGKK